MIDFDPASHTYSIDGERVDGVTDILKRAGLVNTRWFTEYARTRGTAVHKAVQFDDMNALDEEDLDPVLLPYVMQWRSFKDLTGARVINSEQVVWSWSQRFAGTYDKLLWLHGRRTLIDIKTGHAPKWVGAQLGGYCFAALEMGIAVDDLACVVLHDFGFSVTRYDKSVARAEFCAALTKARAA